MQLKNQNGKPRDWRVVAAVTAASAIGLSGLALANPGDSSGAPDSIQLRDRTEITQVTTSVTNPATFNTVLSASADTTNDSPFTDTDTASLDTDSPSIDTESPSPDSDSVSPLVDSDSPSAPIDSGSVSDSASVDSSFDS